VTSGPNGLLGTSEKLTSKNKISDRIADAFTGVWKKSTCFNVDDEGEAWKLTVTIFVHFSLSALRFRVIGSANVDEVSSCHVTSR
jgi:hypothetical protein